MNNAAVADSATRQFAAAVRDFTPKASERFQKLMPFKDGIAELRRKHASYVVIADILRNIDVAVSHDTVGRFCQMILGVVPARRRRRKPRLNGGPRKPSNRPHTPGTASPAARGPRVADPDNI